MEAIVAGSAGLSGAAAHLEAGIAFADVQMSGGALFDARPASDNGDLLTDGYLGAVLD